MNAKRPQPEFELRAEWYQVHYNLAAHRAHLALAEKDRRPKNPRFEEHVNEQKQLLADAEDEARKVVLNAGFTLERLEAAKRDMKSRRPTRRPSADEEGQPASDPEAVSDFLSRTVEPAAAVLLAGLVARDARVEEGGHAEDLGGPFPEGQEVARAAVAEVALGAIRGSQATSVLIGFASQGNPSYRVRYNLACYWSEQIGSRQDKDRAADLALDELERALRDAPSTEGPRLARWAEEDPTLKPLTAAREAEVHRLLRRYQLPVEETD